MAWTTLTLRKGSDDEGIPRAVGVSRIVVPTTGTWHVHNSGRSADSKHIVPAQDEDFGDDDERVERRQEQKPHYASPVLRCRRRIRREKPVAVSAPDPSR